MAIKSFVSTNPESKNFYIFSKSWESILELNLKILNLFRKKLDILEAPSEIAMSNDEFKEKEAGDCVEDDFSLKLQVNYPRGFNFKSRPSF